MSKNKENERKRGALLGGASMLAAAVALVGVAPTASAQDDAVAEEEEAIVVTGSRIARANLTSPTAVATVDAEQIELSGEANVADILQSVPSFGVPAISSANSNFITNNNGVNSLQLRNLGENRTLTLVNGRRYVPGTAGASFVDFNTIPVDLLERVEVITGGASAVYGADALAGVINVMLRDDFEGVQYRYQYGESDYGDDVDQRFSVLAGGNFADGRGNAVVNFVYSRNDGVRSVDRPGTATDNGQLCALVTGDANDCQTIVTDPALAYSSYSAHGRFADQGNANEVWTVDGGVATVFSTAVYGFNRNARRRYTTPNERFMIAGLFNYEINPSIEAFAETMFSHVETASDIEPFAFDNTNLNAGAGPATILYAGIPCTNVLIPVSLANQVCNAGQTAIPFRRRMAEVGDRGSSSVGNTFRILTGLRGDIGDGDYNWEAYYAYGRNDVLSRINGSVNKEHMRAALDAITVGPDIVCRDPIARANGCVPIDIFGIGSISPEAAEYVTADVDRQGWSTQEVAGATINGPLFTLPAGDVSFAAGAEWRREAAADIPDALVQSGQTSNNLEQTTQGSYRVGELFAEVEAPLLRDLPFVEELSVGLAYRWSDYSTLGETEAYSGRVAWQVNDWLRFRAQYAQATRVPNIGELFGPAGENFASVADPCRNVTAADVPGDVDNNCRADPLVNARIVATGSFNLTLAERQGVGGFTGGGNTALDAEVADSYNIGLIANHDFGAPGRLTASVDFWRIELDQQIAVPTRQGSLNGCYDVAVADFDLNSDACQRIVRDAFDPAATGGEVLEVNSTFQNFDGLSFFSGVDVSVAWAFTLSDWFSGAPGDLALRMNWGHTISTNSNERGEPGLTGEVESPEDRIQFGALYSVGPFGFSWESNYVSDVTDDTYETFDILYDVGSYLTHDVRFDWDVNDSTNLYFGSDNVLDEDAPLILSGSIYNTTGTNTDASQYNPIGRSWYAGVRLRY